MTTEHPVTDVDAAVTAARQAPGVVEAVTILLGHLLAAWTGTAPEPELADSATDDLFDVFDAAGIDIDRAGGQVRKGSMGLRQLVFERMADHLVRPGDRTEARDLAEIVAWIVTGETDQ